MKTNAKIQALALTITAALALIAVGGCAMGTTNGEDDSTATEARLSVALEPGVAHPIDAGDIDRIDVVMPSGHVYSLRLLLGAAAPATAATLELDQRNDASSGRDGQRAKKSCYIVIRDAETGRVIASIEIPC